MNFTLQFDMDNAAFGDDEPELANEEVARILDNVRTHVLSYAGEGYILDVNGNTIGEWHINE